MKNEIKKSLEQLEEMASAAKNAPLLKKGEYIEKLGDASLKHAQLISAEVVHMHSEIKALKELIETGVNNHG